MATRWYYRSLGREFGPVPFRELVELVRSGAVTQNDRVRAEWEEEWRWADSVPGLLYSARREAVGSTEPADGGAIESTDGDRLASSAVTEVTPATDTWQPGWLKQLLLFRSRIEGESADRRRNAREVLESALVPEAGADRASGNASTSSSEHARDVIDEDEAIGSAPQRRWPEAVEAACASVDSRSKRAGRAQRGGRLEQLLSAVFSRDALRHGFRWG